MNVATNTEPTQPHAGYADRRDRLLLVEDSPVQAKMLDGMLRTSGVEFDVGLAGTLADASAAPSADPEFACIMLDLTLPDAWGLDGLIDLTRS